MDANNGLPQISNSATPCVEGWRKGRAQINITDGFRHMGDVDMTANKSSSKPSLG